MRSLIENISEISNHGLLTNDLLLQRREGVFFGFIGVLLFYALIAYCGTRHHLRFLTIVLLIDREEILPF